MSLLWYYRPEHTQGGRNPSMHQVSPARSWGRGTPVCCQFARAPAAVLQDVEVPVSRAAFSSQTLSSAASAAEAVFVQKRLHHPSPVSMQDED